MTLLKTLLEIYHHQKKYHKPSASPGQKKYHKSKPHHKPTRYHKPTT